MDISRYDLVITRHTTLQALRRNIELFHIKHTVTNGKVLYFGKRYVKFSTKTLTCVGEINRTQIKIFTIEYKRT